MPPLENKAIGIGIDLGSSAVRVGIYNIKDDKEIEIASQPVKYYQTPKYDTNDHWEYTQSTMEIMDAISYCLEELHAFEYNIVSCGVSATCSIVISTYDNDSKQLVPYQKNDVIFWMDNTSTSESKLLNEICDQHILKTLGGSIIPEMGVSKVMKFLNSIANPNINYVILDLHRYISIQLMKKYNWYYLEAYNRPNFNGIGNDGEIFG